MTSKRRKYKRGDRRSTVDEPNSAKKPNMDTATCVDGNDYEGCEGEESEAQFFEAVPEQEPSLKEIKEMLSSVHFTLRARKQKYDERTG